MARVPYPDPATLSEATREQLARLGDPPLNLFRMLAGGEGLLRAFTTLGGHLLARTELDPRLRELAIVRVGIRTGAAYEVAHHDRIGAEAGLTTEQLAGVRAGAGHPVFGELEAAVLRFVDELVDDVRASDASFAALHRTLSLRALQELTMTVGFYLMVARFLRTFDVDLDAPLTDQTAGTP